MVGRSTDFWEFRVGQGGAEQEKEREWKLEVGQGPGCAGLCLRLRFGKTGFVCASWKSEFPVRPMALTP